MSSITAGGYDKTTMAKDLAGLLDRLGISEVYVAGYDLGAGTAAAFARDYPARVRRVAFLEFGLAGFGYEQFMMPSPDWTLNSNWHLALFTVSASDPISRRPQQRLAGQALLPAPLADPGEAIRTLAPCRRRSSGGWSAEQGRVPSGSPRRLQIY